ncbi:uncharacterized protein [Dermacentor albipictus]|uniref:uncharacterized protein n=1 Tax=Dermacentor albipictus TaxID=60249 RepID=UPI0038FCB587
MSSCDIVSPCKSRKTALLGTKINYLEPCQPPFALSGTVKQRRETIARHAAHEVGVANLPVSRVRAPRRRQHTPLASASRRRHPRTDPPGGNRWPAARWRRELAADISAPRSRRSSRHGRILPRGSLGQVGYVPSTTPKKRTQVCAQERRNDSVALKLVQTALDKSHRLLLDVAARMPNLVPRMDAQECLKRTVCEAHNKPGRYGLLGIALQFFFPPFRPGDADDTRMSPLQLAARYGRDPSADCGRQYDGCFVDPLQALQAAVDHFLRRQQAAHSGRAQLSSGGAVVEQSVAAP